MHAFAKGAGLARSAVIAAGVQAQRIYEQMVIQRGRSGGRPWSTFYEHGFHRNAAADRRWTLEHLDRA
jgi:hypothetical protein